MRIFLNIEAETPEEVMAAIKELSATGVVCKPAEVEPKKNTAPRTNKPATPKTPEPEPATDDTPTTNEPEADNEIPATKEPDTTEIPSITELKEAAVAKGKTPEGKAAIKKLLTSFESPSISAIPEDKRSAFLAALEEL